MPPPNGLVNEDGEDMDELQSQRDDLREDVNMVAKLLADALDADEDCDVVALAEQAAERIAAGSPATAAE